MTPDNIPPRDRLVIRPYTLPGTSFDTLKAHQRTLQLTEDRSAREDGREPRTVTVSEALASVLALFAAVGVSMAVQGIPRTMTLPEYIQALYFGDLKVGPKGSA